MRGTLDCPIDDVGVQETAVKAQAERMIEDLWTEKVRYHIKGLTTIRMGELMDLMTLPTKDQGTGAQMRLGDILKLEGWEKHAEWGSGEKKVIK
jgi:hypothetical protein